MASGPEHLLLMSGRNYARAHLWERATDTWRNFDLPAYLPPLADYEVHFAGDVFVVFGAEAEVPPVGALDIATGTWSDWRGPGAPEQLGTSVWTGEGLFVLGDQRYAAAAWWRGSDGAWTRVDLEGGPTEAGGGVATWHGDVLVGANGDDHIWRYSPTTKSWTSYPYPDDLLSLRASRIHQRLLSVVGDLLVVATACEYYAVLDLVSGEWSVTPTGTVSTPPFETLAQLGGATRFVVYGRVEEHPRNPSGPIWVWAADGVPEPGAGGMGGMGP